VEPKVQLRAEDVSATPVQKVLELLSSMKKKGEEAGHRKSSPEIIAGNRWGKSSDIDVFC